MKRIALVFTGSDVTNIHIFHQAIDVINSTGMSVDWTLYTSSVQFNRMTRQPKIKYRFTTDFVEARHDKTLRCTNVLSGTPDGMKFDKALEALYKVTEAIPLVQSFDVLLEAVGNPCDGYGAAANDMIKALKTKTSLAFKPTILSPEFTQEVALVKNHVLAKNYVQFHTPFIPPILISKNKRTSYTMFETTKIPNTWTPIINNQFSQLYVPSDFCLSVFRNNKITIPIKKVPLGVDIDKWTYKERDYDQPFTFLLFANSHWENPRKNYQLVLNAFTKVFKRSKKVKLILKLTCPISLDVPSNVEVITERYSHEQLLSLLHRSHCLIFTSNGEGYGLPPREAMATGIPCLLTNWSALDEICLPDINWWVNPIKLQPAVFDMSIFPGCNKDFGEFAQIQQSDVEDQMKTIVKIKDNDRGLRAHQWVRDNATYEKAASIFLEGLQ